VATTKTRIRLPDSHRLPGATPPVPLLAAVAGVGLVGAAVVFFAGAPVAWLWLWVCAIATVPVVAWFATRGRLFEPLPLLASVFALMFVTRPLQLMLEWRDLYSHFVPSDPINGLVLLEGQEIALYVSDRLREPLEPAMARALGACALFVVLLLLGYRLAAGRWLGGRLSRLGTTGARVNVLLATGVSLVLGLAAQAAIIARAGGPAASLESASEQRALSDSFALFLLSGFAFAGLLIWVAWRPPRRRLEWAALLLSVASVCGLWIVAGSRARVFLTLLALALLVHYLHRRWRLRELAAALVLLLIFGSSFAVFRHVAGERSLGEAVTAAGDHVLDARVVVNDNTHFDHVLYASTIYGRSRPHERGEFLLNGARSYVPRRIDPDKPEGGDIALRNVVWRERFGAGRPPTAVGDLYIDFGFPGVAVGALLIGVAARSLLGLLLGGSLGREYRVALYAILLIVLYEFVVGTFSIALGFAFTLLLPFLLAVHVFGRLPGFPAPTARAATG
jgi:oligosaccharide repeat unit polymerase